MNENRGNINDQGIKLPEANTLDLRSKQSVRATFKLSEDTILALNVVSSQLGVKQKSLFDHLVADTDALEFIARKLKNTNMKRVDGVQKTVVMSRSTLAILQETAEAYNAPRDALVEFSIQRLKPVIEQEKAKHDTRKRIAVKVRENLEAQRKLLDEAKSLLGNGDPICDELAGAGEKWETAHKSILAFLDRSERVMSYEA